MTVYRSLLAGAVVACALLVVGCAGSGSELTTSSLFGSSKPQPAAGSPTATISPTAAPAAAPVSPQTRALEVAAVSARATKCGYNFDPARLRASFLAAEAQTGLAGEQLAGVEKAYDTVHAGVMKAIVGQGDYCTEKRTDEIKAALTRHLAGDFTVQPKKQVAQKSEGIFGGLFDNDCPDCNKPLTADGFYDITGRSKNSL